MIWRESSEKMTLRKMLWVVGRTVRMMFRANSVGTILIAISNVVESILPSFTTLLFGLMINALTRGKVEEFILYSVIALVLNLVRVLLAHISGYFNNIMQYDIQNYALGQLYLKVTKIPIAVRETKENSDKLEIAENYGATLGWLFPQLVSVVSQAVAFVTAFIVLLNVSLPIAIVVLIVALPSVFTTTYRIRRERKFYKNNSVNRRRGWGFRGQLTDKKSAVELKLNGLNAFFIKQWRHNITRDRQQIINLVDKKLLPYETGVDVVGGFAQFGILLWSGFQVLNNALEVGYLVTIKGLMDNLNQSAYSLAISINQVGVEILNAGDFFGYLELPEEEDGDVVLENVGVPPKIEFKDVTFTYPMSQEPAIRNASFVIEPGEDIALVGENGSGKTTMIKLLFGVYEPDSGQVLIDDIPLERLNKKAYYARMGALFQDYARYDFTDLGDNIWFGDIAKKKEREGLMVAAEKAKLDGMLKKFSRGFSQILSKEYDIDNGTDLSGGQWQRVALARGFWRNPDVLILDEPTSAVDAKAEYEIFREITASQKDKTTIIISHRFSTVRKAQKIMVIKEGTIVERGTHHELMKDEKGLYKEMFELQAEGYLD